MLDLKAIGEGALTYGALSAAARALPAPAPLGNRFYLWFYTFAHLMLANLDKLTPPGGSK